MLSIGNTFVYKLLVMDNALVFVNMGLRQGTCFAKERITAELPSVGLTE